MSDCLICGAESCTCKGAAPPTEGIRITHVMEGPRKMKANEYYSEEGVFLNSAGEVVYGNDPDKKTQIVAAGASVPMDVARRYNLVDADGKPVKVAPAKTAAAKTAAAKAADEDEPVEEQAEDMPKPAQAKAQAAAQNKAQAPKANK
jgi:hypothetical protein